MRFFESRALISGFSLDSGLGGHVLIILRSVEGCDRGTLHIALDGLLSS